MTDLEKITKLALEIQKSSLIGTFDLDNKLDLVEISLALLELSTITTLPDKPRVVVTKLFKTLIQKV